MPILKRPHLKYQSQRLVANKTTGADGVKIAVLRKGRADLDMI